MLERQILHIDINHCYAQMIEMLYPDLKEVAMAVGGDEERRSGIILARNLKAKEKGVKTAETLREALAKCPELVIVPPQFQYFIYYANQVKDIYREYTDKVESFGIDEAWLDLTHSQALFGSAEAIMDEIQARVLSEVGLTVSCGLSFNKIFAKLGSDMIKPAGRVIIRRDNYEEIVFKLPVEDLLYVGPKTKEKFNELDIMSIGDLAKQQRSYLKNKFGKNGEMLWYFANGYDQSDVSHKDVSMPLKSVGNSITTPADIRNSTEALIVFQVLAESVASRLRDAGLVGNVISISLRNTELKTIVRQRKIQRRTDLAFEIMETIRPLLKENYYFDLPLRSIGVSVSNVIPTNHTVQLNLFVDEEEREKQSKLELSIDAIRTKFGHHSISQLSVKLNTQLTDFNPKAEHVIHPVSWFK